MKTLLPSGFCASLRATPKPTPSPVSHGSASKSGSGAGPSSLPASAAPDPVLASPAAPAPAVDTALWPPPPPRAVSPLPAVDSDEHAKRPKASTSGRRSTRQATRFAGRLDLAAPGAVLTARDRTATLSQPDGGCRRPSDAA